MPQKLKKLVWLLEHIPSLIRAHRGFIPLLVDAITLMKKIGVRPVLGLFMGQAAYESRNSNDAYRQWMRIREGSHNEALTFEQLKAKHEEEFLFLLHPNAKANDVAASELDRYLSEKTSADIFYGDHDRITASGERLNPQFKPSFSIDLLRSSNYLGLLVVIRKSSIDKVGKLQEADVRFTLFDWLLRAYEHGFVFEHVPSILSHHENWKPLDSVDDFWRAKSDVLFNHLQRMYGRHLNVGFSSDDAGTFSARFVSRDALVSIIIPTKDQLHFLEQCINSILSETIDCRYEIIVLNNNSTEGRTFEWFDSARKNSLIKILDAPYPFNWSKLNNQGIAAANGNVFVFLNNDTRVITKTWLRQLAGQALRPDVGSVGPLLLYADGTVQHAGVVVGYGGQADHVYSGFPPDVEGSVFVSPLLQRNVLASTGACLAISQQVISKVGAFDESLSIVGSDIKICLRAHEHGLLNVYDPSVKLYHYESKTRSNNVPKRDHELAAQCYEKFVQGGDPFFNKNISLASKFPLTDVFRSC